MESSLILAQLTAPYGIGQAAPHRNPVQAVIPKPVPEPSMALAVVVFGLIFCSKIAKIKKA